MNSATSLWRRKTAREAWRWPAAEDFAGDVRYGIAHAAPQSGVYGGRVVDARDRDRREHRGLQRGQQRAAQAAALSQGRGTGGAAADRSGRRGAGEFRERAACFRLRCISPMPSRTEHFNRWACGSPAPRTSQGWPSRSRCARCRSAMACFRRSAFRPAAGRWLSQADQVSGTVRKGDAQLRVLAAAFRRRPRP